MSNNLMENIKTGTIFVHDGFCGNHYADFFEVTKTTPTTVTLQRLNTTADLTEAGRGTKLLTPVPGSYDTREKPFRRKVITVFRGVVGVPYKGGGYAILWDGQPKKDSRG